MYRVAIRRARQPYVFMIASWKYEKHKDYRAMRVPILYMSSPGQKFWLTDDHAVSPTGQPVLIDATGRVYCPTEARGLILVTEGICSFALYDAAQRVGYHVVWRD